MERRKKSIDLLESQMGSLDDDIGRGLVGLVKQCLHNAPEERPKTSELHDTITRIERRVTYLEEKCSLTPSTRVRSY